MSQVLIEQASGKAFAALVRARAYDAGAMHFDRPRGEVVRIEVQVHPTSGRPDLRKFLTTYDPTTLVINPVDRAP